MSTFGYQLRPLVEARSPVGSDYSRLLLEAQAASFCYVAVGLGLLDHSPLDVVRLAIIF